MQGRELIARYKAIDTCLAGWLLALDDFDTWGAWAEDGASSCLSWLQTHCRMARSTAADKLRVACQLGRRKVLADALVAGEVSYSQVRALTRVERVDDDSDLKLLDVAAETNMAQLECFVAHQRHIADQDRPPADDYDKRGLYRLPGFAGSLDRLIIDAAAEDIERIICLLDAFLDAEYRTSRKSSLKTLEQSEESSMKTPDSEPLPKPGIRARRVDALLDLLEHAAYEHHDGIDAERAAIGVTVDYDTLIDRNAGWRRPLSSRAPSSGAKPAVASLATPASTASSPAANPRSSTSAARPGPGPSASAAPLKPATATNAASPTAGGASSKSTTSSGGRTTATPPSTTASPSVCTTTTSPTKAAGTSPTTRPPAPPRSPDPTAKPSSPTPASPRPREPASPSLRRCDRA